MTRPYREASLRAGVGDPAQVRALQADLRCLGYLRGPIDGVFGTGTTQGVRALQYDLLNNGGESTREPGDGRAPVAMTSFRGAVTAVTGVVDQALADSIDALLAAESCPKLPRSETPAADNKDALAFVTGSRSAVAPAPFMLAIMRQESGLRQFAVPTQSSTDDYVVVGLDRAAGADQVRSRGYGLSQYTLFHHPPRPEDVAGLMTDARQNARAGYGVLRGKFDTELVGSTPETIADDRKAEQPILDLRVCRYGPADRRFLTDCQNCARLARKLDIGPATPVYAGSPQTYGEADDYGGQTHFGVPDRAEFGCDWPYAVRRYNGSGPNSYHYQAIVLLNVLAGPPALGSTV
jgi:peptidoglycan hydrolase-like protein with peptidoglycan-binding domain